MTEGLPDHVLTIDIMVPLERVWAEITKIGRVQRAMVNTVLESTMKVGSKLRYTSPDRKRVFVVGEVVEVVPPHKFSHTYMFTTRTEQPSLVTWELEEIPGGCRVKLTHAGWTNQVKTHKSVLGGWRDILSILKTELETGDIPFKTKFTYRMLSAFMFMLPGSTKPDQVSRAGW
ncbi:MAG: SRPBCC domain-containing protein [Longimicrobiales bacterium]